MNWPLAVVALGLLVLNGALTWALIRMARLASAGSPIELAKADRMAAVATTTHKIRDGADSFRVPISPADMP